MGIESPNPIEDNDNIEVKPQNDGIRKKLKNVANAMMLASALSGAPGIVKSAEAQGGQTARSEQESEDNINNENLTKASKWSIDLLKSIKSDFPKIRTNEDAEALAIDVCNMYNNYYEHSVGHSSEFSDDDYKMLEKNITEAKELLLQLNRKYPLRGYENRLAGFDTLLKHLEHQNSFAGKKERERMKKLEQVIK